MAITRRTTKTGTTRFAVTWYEAGQQREKWFTRRSDAVAFDADIKLRKQRQLPVFDDRTTVRELCALVWNTHYRQRSQRMQSYARTQLTLRIAPEDGGGLGAYRVADLDPPTVAAWLGELRDAGTGPSSLNATMGILSAVFRKGIEWQLIARNPMAGVKKFPVTARGIEVYPPAQVLKIAAAANTIRQRDGAAIITAAFTGLRISEVFALQWQDIRDNHVRVDRALDEDRTFKAPKSYQQRTVPLFDIVARTLTEWRAAAPRGGGLVFPGTTGQPIHESNWNRRSWQPARKLAGLPDARFHELRHSFASMCIEDGVPVVRLSKWLGHARPSITMDIYGHLYDANDDEAMLARVNHRIAGHNDGRPTQ